MGPYFLHILVLLYRMKYDDPQSQHHDILNPSGHIPYGEEKDRIFNNRPQNSPTGYNHGPAHVSDQGSRGVALDELLPFGTANGDTKLQSGDDNYERVSLDGKPFVYFQSSYDKMYINTNGAISFLRGVHEYKPTCGAMQAPTPMIVPFWADVDTRYGGSVYYRQTSKSSILDQVSRVIRKAFPNNGKLDLKWAFIATWDQVPFFGSSRVGGTSDCAGHSLRNTFQTILVRDEHQSFVFFFYHKIQWTTGTATGGDSCTGLGGKPAKAGFDYGDSENFFTIPSSCTAEIIDVAQTSNFNQKGKWAFRVTESVENTCDVTCEDGKDFYADPYDCNSFYHCAHGFPNQKNCREGQVWYPEKETCVPSKDYHCEPICFHE